MSPPARVLLYAGALAIVGGAFLAITPTVPTGPERLWSLPFFALVIGFGVAESAALHVEIRKESHSLSLSGIPLMFGLLYLSPALLVLAYLVGSVPAMLFIRKSDVLKTTWNSSLFFAEAALASFIVRSFLGNELPTDAVEWMVPLGAVLAAELVSLLAVPFVIMAVDAKFRPNLFGDVGQSQILAALAGTFTVTAASASLGDPYMLLFAVVPVIGIGVLLQSSGQLSQRYRDLQQLHVFTRALTNERGARTVDTGLAQLVQIMRSRSSGLLTVADDSQHASTIRALVDDTFEDIDPRLIEGHLVGLLDHEPLIQITLDDLRPEATEVLRHLQASRLLAARVLGDVDRVGVLFVADRLGMRNEFTIDELGLFGSLARTFSARLSNDHLVAELETQAQHDALTKLPNRLNFEIALTAALADNAQSGLLVMLDLDRFKEINDSLGHETGDHLLIEIAARLRAATRSTDMVARFGGDEFAMLLTERSTDGLGDVTRRISDIHAQLTSKVELEGIMFEIGASMGVVQWPDHGSDSTSLLHRADTAMYEAKRNQLGVVWYSAELDADAPRRLDLYLSVRSALENDELFIHLQPQVSVRTGEILRAESLVRWNHPTYGPISPLEFVPLISQAGMIGKLTRFVIRRTVETVALLQREGIDLPVAINLTPRDLLDPSLPGDIARILHDNDVHATSLHVEITEDAMVVDFDASVAVLNGIRALGIKVSIDDFGTGYSSLQHLHRLPVDELKIDRSFISRIATDESAAAIVRASINLARDLGLGTVAEGIEDAHSLRLVADLGCDAMQGYLVSRPLAALDFVRWVRDWQPTWLVEALDDPALGPRSTRARGRVAMIAAQ